MMASNNDAVPATQTPKVSPTEVAWDFVPQYYTYVNKQPGRLHCFYTKNSTFIHGTEGEEVKACHGQQEIHSKILSIGFQDCKVFINSVDAQSSADGGIIIQVIGEMSNNGEVPSRKFAQTVFLAEQPNGYFVLNDIFRFLKEEYSGEEDYNEEQEESPNETVVAPTQDEPVPHAAPPVVDAPAPEPDVAVAEVAVPEVPKSNGIHLPPTEPTPAPEPEKLAPPPPTVPTEPPKSETASPAPKPATLPAAPSPSASPAPPSTTTTEPETPAPPAPEPAPAPPSTTTAPPPVQQVPLPKSSPIVISPTPSGPPPPKTWANLAAANSTKWGAQVAQEAKGVSTAPPPAVRTATPPRSAGPSGPSRDAQARDGRDSPAATLAAATTQCFVKGVTENVSNTALKELLLTRFGPVKELDIVRNKACAFLEFDTVEAARKAILASLPVSQGGEGGIRVEDGRITVELRKERSERMPPRTRGGGPNGDSRGGFRGRGGDRGGSRGRAIPK